MPIPTTPGALPAAHRVVCLRSVRAMARGQFVDFEFASASSKKCAYCTLQNEKCNPVPAYAGAEFAVFWEALGAYELALGSDEEGDRKTSEAGVRSAAYELASCVQVATAQFKNLSAVDVLLASHYQMAEENRALRGQLSEMAEAMVALAKAQAELTAKVGGMGSVTARGGGRRAGREGGRGGRRKRERGGEKEDEEMGGTVEGGSNSELSSVHEFLSGDEVE